MDQQVLFVVIFLFHENWSNELFQLVRAEKEKENECSTSNPLNGRKNSPVATKQYIVCFLYTIKNLLHAKIIISGLGYPHKLS